MPLRVCKFCSLEAHTEQDLQAFKKKSSLKYGRHNLCKKCEYQNRLKNMTDEQKKAEASRKAEWTRNHKEYFKEWRKKGTYLTNHAKAQAKRRALKKQAIPAWYNNEEVEYIYNLARERELEVDHIVPLNHPLVCGLHVQDNLRCIPKELNLWKSNKILDGVRNGF